MINVETIINKLRNQAPHIDVISDEVALTNIITTNITGNVGIECSSVYPCLDNKKCDIKLCNNDNASSIWIEAKDNITLLPFGNSKIIYEQNKLIFLDIARLIVGVNSSEDARVVIANIDKAIVNNYYSFDIGNTITTCFTAEDVLPSSNNRKRFVELKLTANIATYFIDCNSTYMTIIHVLDGFVDLLVYKNLDDRDSEGESKNISFIEQDFEEKSSFLKKYFPAS